MASLFQLTLQAAVSVVIYSILADAGRCRVLVRLVIWNCDGEGLFGVEMVFRVSIYKVDGENLTNWKFIVEKCWETKQQNSVYVDWTMKTTNYMKQRFAMGWKGI